jgi:energy-coupling factor transporter ATP-binding protein EcfA2
MYVKKIELKNIRGFEHLDFDLERPGAQFAGWTVFTGGNGSGKSSLLKALALCLINYGVMKDHINIMMDLESMIRRPKSAIDSYIESTVVLNGRSVPGLIGGIKQDHIFVRMIYLEANYLPNQIFGVKGDGSESFFSCGYGPFRRLFGASQSLDDDMKDKDRGRYVTMFREGASLAATDQWLQDLKFKTLEGDAASRDQLDLVLQILNDDLLPNQMSVIEVNSEGLWLKDRNGVQLSWSDMSDGYRSATAMLADILRHMIATYGVDGLTDRDKNGRIFVKRSGVVLIDEVDAHLHPEWQRTIGFWLKRHFPNVQFIVTTHSPLVCQAADPNGLFVLPDPASGDKPRAMTDEEYRKIIASKPDDILLSPAFNLENTRSEPAIAERIEHADLRAKQLSGLELNTEDQKRLSDLDDIIKVG